jgi:hypothetical protein
MIELFVSFFLLFLILCLFTIDKMLNINIYWNITLEKLHFCFQTIVISNLKKFLVNKKKNILEKNFNLKRSHLCCFHQFIWILTKKCFIKLNIIWFFLIISFSIFRSDIKNKILFIELIMNYKSRIKTEKIYW